METKDESTAKVETKIYTADDLTVDEGAREVVGIITTDTVDNDGEVLLPGGCVTRIFQGNPICYTNHAYKNDDNALPIGKVRWLKSGKSPKGNDCIIAKAYISDRTQESRDVFGLVQDGIMKAFSVGFIPLEASKPTAAEIRMRPDWKSAKKIIRKWQMIELSVVGLPCNDDALVMAVSKGRCSEIMAKSLSNKKPEEKTTEVIPPTPASVLTKSFGRDNIAAAIMAACKRL